MELTYAILSVLSYLAILAKDIVVANAYGANDVTDGFFFAYQVVFIFLVVLGGIGGPFYKTTVLLASGIVERPKTEIKTLLNSFLTTSGLCFLILSIGVFIFSGSISKLLMPEATDSFRGEIVTQLRILSPVIFIGGITGILSGISNTYGKFFQNAAAPALAGIVFITIIILFGSPAAGFLPAFAMLAACISMLAYQLLNFSPVGFKYKPEFDFSHPRFIIIRKLFFPLFFTVLIGNLFIFVDMFFVSGFTRRNLYVFDYSGGWSELYYAYSIFMFVAGLLASLLGTLTFKEMENTTKEIYLRSLSNYYSKVLDLVMYTSIPVALFIILFSRDIVKFIYERGEFTSSVTVVVTNILMILALSLFPFLLKSASYKLYESLNSLKTPLLIAIGALVLKTVLNFIFINFAEMGINGIALSTLLVVSIEAGVLAFFIKKHIKVDYEALIYLTVQIIPVILVTAVVIYLEKLYFDMVLPEKHFFLGIKLLFYLLTAGVSYYVLSLPVRIYVAEELFNGIMSMKPFTILKQEVKKVRSLVTFQSKDYEHLYKELALEKDKSEKLLSNILPGHVAQELKETGSVKPVNYDNASVMFADIQGYTRISKVLSKEQLIQELDSYYKLFDVICEKYSLEKIKTIGDSYMCVGGVPVQNKTHAIDSVLAAFCFLIYMHKVKVVRQQKDMPAFNLRIGINSGSVVAGVIGANKSSYDVWGDAVNIASRMESAGEPGKINISESTYELVKEYFDCAYRGEKEVKNAGNIKMYYVCGIKPEFADSANKLIPNDKFNTLYKELKNS